MELETLRTLAAVATILAAAVVAANWNARVTVSEFAIFIVASIRLDDRRMAGEQEFASHPERRASAHQRVWHLALAAESRK